MTENISSSPEKFELNGKLEKMTDNDIKDFLYKNYSDVKNWIIENKWNNNLIEQTEAWENFDEVLKLSQILWLNENDLKAIPVKEFLTKLNEFMKERIKINNQSIEKLEQYKEIIENESSNWDIKTWESNTNIRDDFLWFTISSKERTNLSSNINLDSLKTILKNIDLKKLYEDLFRKLKLNSKGEISFSSSISFFSKDQIIWQDNSYQIEKYFEDLGYSSNWIFDYKEKSILFSTISDIYKTQQLLNNWDYSQKSKILFDFNSDWIISSKVNFNLQETQSLLAINNEKTFNNVLTNLWMDPSLFKEDFSKNYFLARELLKDKLASFLENKNTSAKQLLLNPLDFQHSKKYINSKIEEQNNSLEKTKQQLWKKLDEALDEYNKTSSEKINVSDDVKRQSINLMIWDLNWASLTVDSLWKKVSSLTNWLLDNVSFWYANWKIWLIIWWSKKFLNGKATISGWLANFVPYIWLDWKLIESRNAQKAWAFSNDIKTWVNVEWGINVTPLWFGWHVDFNRSDEQTDTWIQKMVETTSEAIDKYIAEFPKNFEETWFPQEEKESYEKVLQEYKNIILNNDGSENKALIPEFKAWILRAYQNELYKNAEWLKFSWITIWTLWPIVYIGPKFQKISQEYVKKDTNIVDKYIEDNKKRIEEENRRLEAQLLKPIELTSEEIRKWIDAVEKSDLDAVKSVNSQISSYIEWDKIIKALSWSIEKEIHELLKWKGWDISKIFENFISKIDKKNTVLIDALNSFKDWNDIRKILILQNVAINLMKKEWLKVKDGSVNIVWQTNVTRYIKVKGKKVLVVEKVDIKNLSDYDSVHGRDKYFDDIFKEEFKAFAWDIQNARKIYYGQYWSKAKYSLRTLSSSEWVAMAWVEIWTWNNKFKWINPYVTPNIATFEKWDWKINFEPKNLEASTTEMANKIPEHFITPMVNDLTNLGYKFTATDEKWKIAEFRELVVAKWKWDLEIKNNFYFAKAWECLNDMILMNFDVKYKNKIIIPWVKVDIKNAEEEKLDAFNAENNVIDVTTTWSKDRTPKDTPNPWAETQTWDKVLSVNSSADATNANVVNDSIGANGETFAEK